MNGPSTASATPANFHDARLLPGHPNGTSWPRISLVTAVYNGELYLETTIRSILGQNYPNLEYIIVDDGSTDHTVDIIRKYEQHLACWFSQPNKGLYGALNAGFSRSSGEIMGWLNCSDMLHVNGLFVVGSVFTALPEVDWITGRPTTFSPSGLTVQTCPIPRWSRRRFLAGANKYIQQESTFWRRSLWERVGGRLSEVYRAEGDFELWLRFFRHARLYSVDALIGGYRLHEGALSHGNIERYNAHCDEIVECELDSVRGGGWVKLFRRMSRSANRIPKVRWLWRRLVLEGLYKWPGPDRPPLIEYHMTDNRWIVRK